MNNNKYLTVAALNKYLYYKFDNDLNLRDIYLKAEISNVRLSKGILYFVLKDNEWKNKQLLIEADKISKLSLTKRELFLCLYKALGITPESIRASILENQEALIEFDYAEKYYRGNPLVESLGLALGLTSEIIDKIFISGGNPDVITNKGGDGTDA